MSKTTRKKMGRPTKPEAEKVTTAFTAHVNAAEAERIRGYYERHPVEYKTRSDFVKTALMWFIKQKQAIQTQNTIGVETV